MLLPADFRCHGVCRVPELHANKSIAPHLNHRLLLHPRPPNVTNCCTLHHRKKASCRRKQGPET